MMSDKKTVKVARKTFQSSLKDSRIHYRREKRDLKKSLPKKRFMIRRSEKSDVKEHKKIMQESYRAEKEAAKASFENTILYASPRRLKAKEIKKYRLPHAKNRLRIAKKHLTAVKQEERNQTISPKFSFHKDSDEHPSSRFHFKRKKTLERLQAEKEMSSAKHEVKQLKQAHKTKKIGNKVKRGLGLVASETFHLVSQDDDLDAVRSLRELKFKSSRYARLTYQSGKILVKSSQAGFHIAKKKLVHGTERYHNFKRGKGWRRNKPLKQKRRYQTFLRQVRKQSVTGFKSMIHLLKGSLTFFSTLIMNPLTWLISSLLFLLIIMISFVISVSGMSLIQQDEMELTKSYTYMTLEDANHTKTSDKGITYYTKIDDVMIFMNQKYQNYALTDVMENSHLTYKDYLSQMWTDLNSGSSLKSMSELSKLPFYKLSDEEQKDLKELSEESNYFVLQDLENPFQGKTEEDILTMTYRYGYDVKDERPTLHHHIILEANENQVIVAPMDGKVSLDGDDIILSSGKGGGKRKLTLFNINNGRLKDGQKILSGDIIGKTKDKTGLKVTYQKVDDDTENLVYVNPAFYFPRVIQLQTTILPMIGQFGGDEFARAKMIYDYLKSLGATNQAIAAILGNWSVESSINPKRAEGDYLSPPIGATESSWDEEAWLSLNGPAIYNGSYPNILRRGLGLGQWTDTADGSRRHTLLLEYAKRKNQKWYDLALQLDFMLHGDSPYATNWLKDFFKKSGSPASLAQDFLIYWEGNSGDKLIERQTRATEWYYQIEQGFSQPNGGRAQSDPKALAAVRAELYDNSVPGGGDGMGYAYGQCTWGVASRINQLGLKLKGRNGEKIALINTMGNGQDWVSSAYHLGGEIGSIPKEGAIISFKGGSHETQVLYGHVGFVGARRF